MVDQSGHQKPSREYRDALRYGLRALATDDELGCICMGKSTSDLTMEELEVGYQLVFSADPGVHAPPEYRTSRRA